MNYSVSIESLHKNFPPGFTPPLLLLEFAQWLKDQPAASVGYFRLQSERFDDYHVENGADLHSKFAFFLRDATGGQVGYWLYDGRSTKFPPIILFGSEGKLRILAGNLWEFLYKLAVGQTKEHDLDNRIDGERPSKELAQWLDARGPDLPTMQRLDHPDLQQWLQDWSDHQLEWMNKDAHYVQITELLRKYVAPNAEPWQREAFDVLLAGSQFNVWHRSFSAKPLPKQEVKALEPLFRHVREQRARKTPERGLWFYAWVTVGSRGVARLNCNFMYEPKILDERPNIPRSEYYRDLRAFPRSDYWKPDWLT